MCTKNITTLLAILNPSDSHQREFDSIQERFYAIAAKIETITSTTRPGASTSDRESTEALDNHKHVIPTKKRRIKLPEVSLPFTDVSVSREAQRSDVHSH